MPSGSSRERELCEKLLDAAADADPKVIAALGESGIRILYAAAEKRVADVFGGEEIDSRLDDTRVLSESASKFERSRRAPGMDASSEKGCCDKVRQCFSSMFSCGKKDAGDHREDEYRTLDSDESPTGRPKF